MSVSTNQKLLALGTLCIQNSALILSMRYSRSVLQDTYLDSTIVLIMELVKLSVSCALVWREKPGFKHLAGIARSSAAMAVPSLLYVLQNTLQLMAVQNLDASTFSVLSQLKVLTTALASAIWLGTHISPRKWRALALLCGGCILVNYKPPTPQSHTLTSVESEAAAAASASIVMGLICTCAMVTLSGVTGVYIERKLKNASVTLWERNVQLSLWGAIFASMAVTFRDGNEVASRGFFAGWSSFAVIVVLCQSVGGLVTALVVKYTDTIIKGFVVGLSVVITSILSYYLFATELSLQFAMGAGAVLLSVFNFNEADSPSVTPPIYVPSAEAKKTNLINPGTPFIPQASSATPAHSARNSAQSVQEDGHGTDEELDQRAHFADSVMVAMETGGAGGNAANGFQHSHTVAANGKLSPSPDVPFSPSTDGSDVELGALMHHTSTPLNLKHSNVHITSYHSNSPLLMGATAMGNMPIKVI